jgi:hypothetical protein
MARRGIKTENHWKTKAWREKEMTSSTPTLMTFYIKSLDPKIQRARLNMFEFLEQARQKIDRAALTVEQKLACYEELQALVGRT